MTTKQRIALNRESLATLRSDGTLLDGESLALDVDKKVDAGQELTQVEAGVLWLGITQEQVEFTRNNLLTA